MPFSIKRSIPLFNSKPVNILTSFSFKNNMSVLDKTGSNLSNPKVESKAPGAKDSVFTCLAAA
jgi:hypothetical protein